MKLDFKRRLGVSLFVVSFAFSAFGATDNKAKEEAEAAAQAQQRQEEQQRQQEAQQRQEEQQRQQEADQQRQQAEQQRQQADQQRLQAEQQRQQADQQRQKDQQAEQARQRATQQVQQRVQKDPAPKQETTHQQAQQPEPSHGQAGQGTTPRTGSQPPAAAQTGNKQNGNPIGSKTGGVKPAPSAVPHNPSVTGALPLTSQKQQTLTKQKTQLAAVKLLTPNNPEVVQAAAVETTTLKNQNQGKLKAIDQGRPVVATPKAHVLPAPKAGSTFGVNPKANVSIPKKMPVPVQVGVQGQPSYKANPKIASGISACLTKRDGFRTRFAGNGPVGSRVSNFQRNYTQTYNTTIINRGRDFDRYYRGDGDFSYRYYYSPWWDRGFYGGYYYPVDCVYGDDLSAAFWNPTIFWMYANTYEPDYYSAYYGDYWYWHTPRDTFAYAGVYLPTTALFDWANVVSSYSYDRHWAFRQALTNLTTDLIQSISYQTQSTVQLNSNDIVINHFEVVSIDDGIYEVDGFVDDSWLHIPFKATVNINDPSDTGTNFLFVPVAQDPSLADPNQIAQLDAINNLMNGYNPGSALQSYVEPQQTY